MGDPAQDAQQMVMDYAVAIRPGFDGFNVLLRAYQLAGVQLFQSHVVPCLFVSIFEAVSLPHGYDPLRCVMAMLHKWYLMAQSMADRTLQLLNATSLKELAEVNSKDYVRWQSTKQGRARIGAEEVELLGRLYPQYRWWLITGEVMPDKGQVSPDYDEANRNLPNQNAG